MKKTLLEKILYSEEYRNICKRSVLKDKIYIILGDDFWYKLIQERMNYNSQDYMFDSKTLLGFRVIRAINCNDFEFKIVCEI